MSGRPNMQQVSHRFVIVLTVRSRAQFYCRTAYVIEYMHADAPYLTDALSLYMAKAHEIGTSRVEKIDISHFSPRSI